MVLERDQSCRWWDVCKRHNCWKCLVAKAPGHSNICSSEKPRPRMGEQGI